jgi:hypothetical protein
MCKDNFDMAAGREQNVLGGEQNSYCWAVDDAMHMGLNFSNHYLYYIKLN